MTTRVSTTPKERADIFWVKAQSISQLVHAGFTATSARDAIVRNDFSVLVASNGAKNDS